MKKGVFFTLFVATIFTSCKKDTKNPDQEPAIMNTKAENIGFNPAFGVEANAAGAVMVTDKGQYGASINRRNEGVSTHNATLYFSSTDIASSTSTQADSGNPYTFSLANNRQTTVTIEFRDNATTAEKAGNANLKKVVMQMDKESTVSVYVDSEMLVEHYMSNLGEAVLLVNNLANSYQALPVNVKLLKR